MALLIHAVAPAATLLLAPVGTDEGLDEERIVAAIGLAVEAGADVINLSMGRSIPYKEAVDDEVARAAYRDPGGDPLVNHAEHRRAHPDWRTALRPRPADPLERAVAGAIAAGCTVVAAAGNSLSHVYSPGLVTGVVSVGFVKDVRALAKEGGEISQAGKPTGFSQTVWHDLGLVQPAGTIGTSFAAPLTSGLVATMPDRSVIPRYLRAAALAAEADLLATVPRITGQRYEAAGVDYEIDTQSTGLGGIAAPVLSGSQVLGMVSLVMSSRLLMPRPPQRLSGALRKCVEAIQHSVSQQSVLGSVRF